MGKKIPYETLKAENEALRMRMEEAEEALRAIRKNEVDALVVEGPQGLAVYTLQGAEQPYRAFLEYMNEGAVTVTSEGTILYCNKQFAEMLRLPLHKAMGGSLYTFLKPEAGQPALKTLVRACGAEGFTGDFLLGTSASKRMSVHLSAGRVALDTEVFCMVITDLTEERRIRKALQDEVAERTRAEEALRESETCYRRLVEIAEEGIWAVDQERRTTFVNAKAAEMLGYTVEELQGQDYRRFMVEDDAAIAPHRTGKGRSGAGRHPTARFRKKNGEIVLCRISACPITDDQGSPVGTLAMLTDVTEQRSIEKQLRESQKLEAIGTLAGGIAHDFNNILAGIIGFSEMALDQVPEGTPLRRHLSLIYKSGLRGRDLVKQILAFSRKSEHRRKPTDLAPLVKQTVAFLSSSLPSTIRIETHLVAEQSTTFADPSEIQQILMNLATNAGQAMRDKGGLLDIAVRDAEFAGQDVLPDPDMRPGRYLLLSVRDTGAGMTEEVRRRMFEPFFTTKGSGQGTGLGLAVVYGIVKDLHGGITVASTPGEGTKVSIYLSKMEPVAEVIEKAAPARKTSGRILVVDDEEVLVEMIASMLNHLGYAVTATRDAAEALDLFSKDPQSFDLVLTDQTMPFMTGFALARDILSIRPGTPIILATGYSETVSYEQAASAGISQFILKPVTKTELAEAVRKALGKKP